MQPLGLHIEQVIKLQRKRDLLHESAWAEKPTAWRKPISNGYLLAGNAGMSSGRYPRWKKPQVAHAGNGRIMEQLYAYALKGELVRNGSALPDLSKNID